MGRRSKYSVAMVSWQQAEFALTTIRRQVFIEEQMVPDALEWDGQDAVATHFLAVDGMEHAIACARLLSDGSLGRMAVLPAWRRQGVGRTLLAAAIDECRRQGFSQLKISAQVHATEFYRQAGFIVHGDVYRDAGILHHDMRLELAP